MSKELNILTQDKFKVVFSDFPSLSSNPDFNTFDMELIHNNIQSVTVPDISLNLIESGYRGSTFLHSDTRSNADINLLNITFKVSENLTNYKAFLNWMKNLKSENVGYESSRKNVIKTVSIKMLNNQKQLTNVLKFSTCFLVNLSALELNFSESEELSFIVTLRSEELEF